MLLLAFDMATSAFSAAILTPDGPLAYFLEKQERGGQAERLIPAIGSALQTAGVEARDLTHIAVSAGPGSFTGVRAGVAAARAFALALGIPVLPVTTLALSAAALADEAPATVILSAGRGLVYAQNFASNAPVSEILLLGAGEVMDRLRPVRILAAPDIAAASDPARSAAHEDPGLPDARRMLALARNADPSRWTMSPEPLYIRPPDAVVGQSLFRAVKP